MKKNNTFKISLLAVTAAAFMLTGCLSSDSSSSSGSAGSDATQGSGGKVSQPPSSYQELNEETVAKVVQAYVLGDRAIWQAEDWVDEAYDFIDDETDAAAAAAAAGVAASSGNGRQSLAGWLNSFKREKNSVQAAFMDDENKSGVFECDNSSDGGVVNYKISEAFDEDYFVTFDAELSFSNCMLDDEGGWYDLSGQVFDGSYMFHYSDSELDESRDKEIFHMDYDIDIASSGSNYNLLGRIAGESIFNLDSGTEEKFEIAANIQVEYGANRVSLTNVKLDELEGTASGVFYHTDLDGRLDVVSEELSDYDELITLKSGEASLKITMPDNGDLISVEGLGCNGEWSIDEIIEGNHCSE